MKVQQRCVTLCGNKGSVRAWAIEQEVDRDKDSTGAWAAEQGVDGVCHPAQEMVLAVKGVHGFYSHPGAP